MTGWRTGVLAAALGISAVSCRDVPEKPTVGQQNSAVEATPQESALEYPQTVQVTATSDVARSGLEARKASETMDQECAFLQISDELTPLRPDSLGCPRPAEPVESWGAR